MLRDAGSTRRYLHTEKQLLPYPISYGHPVSANPTGSPAYIDGQVADILVEMQEKPVSKFFEGELIGAVTADDAATVFQIDAGKFSAMMNRVFVRHKKLPRKLRHLTYTLVRSTDGTHFHITYLPEADGFRVKVIE
jgi:hypothetical protein